MASFSSFSSYFLLLCLSMFLAVSSLGKAMSYDYDYSGYESYDDDEPDYDYPQTPAPESEDGGDYDYPQPPPAESEDGGDYDYEYDNDYPQPPAPESEDGGDYDNGCDDDYPQPPTPESGDGSNDDDDDNYLSLAPEYCPDVVERISTCQEYLNGHKDSPSPACCDNLDDLSYIGVEVGFRDMCDCMKDLQASFHQRRAEDEIFRKCGSEYSFLPISQQECSKY